MKTFALRADCTFQAEDIEDAFKRLAEHFRALGAGEDAPFILESGDISIEPAKHTTS